MLMRRFMPPENVSIRLLAWSSRPAIFNPYSIASASVCPPSPYMRPQKRRFSAAVSVGYSAISCGTTPSTRRTALESLRTEWPSTSTSPASGASKHEIMEMVVVLPAPFGPSRPKIEPRTIENDTPSTAVMSPNRFTSPSAVTMAGAGSDVTAPGRLGRTTHPRPSCRRAAGRAAPCLRRCALGPRRRAHWPTSPRARRR